MKKKLIFLDGDGTLWYPSATKRTIKPHWAYLDPSTRDNSLMHLELTPQTKETLEVLKGKGLYLVVISANPHDKEIALQEIAGRIEHFGLGSLFHSYHASDGSDPSGKADIMLDVIKQLRLNKEDAVMVGDSYFYDYMAAKDIGIDAFFIENEVAKMPDVIPTDIKIIKEIRELVDILE